MGEMQFLKHMSNGHDHEDFKRESVDYAGAWLAYAAGICIGIGRECHVQ